VCPRGRPLRAKPPAQVSFLCTQPRRFETEGAGSIEKISAANGALGIMMGAGAIATNYVKRFNPVRVVFH